MNYVDLQVNGYAGVDFNGDDLSPEDLHAACEALRRDGVAAILATIVSDDLDAMARRLARVVELRQRDDLAESLIAGLHVEGPFINPEDGYRGAHPLDAIRPATIDAAMSLLDAAGGLAKILTLAPEYDEGSAVTRRLVDEGVIVSAGHCNPSLDQLDAALDAGLSMWTHLGNGCPMQMHRHDNVVQRALSRRDRLFLGFIADGVHVAFCALGNYLALAGENAFIVSDAMAAAGLGPGRHRIGRWELDVGEDLAAWAPDRGHLVGSAMTMARAHTHLTDHLALPIDRIRQLLHDTPAALIGL